MGTPRVRRSTSSHIANGTITDEDINGGANIADTKLAPITSAGKVSGNAVNGGTITADLSGNATNVTGVVAIAHGRTSATTASDAFDALSPITTEGDTLIGNQYSTA